MPGSRLVEPTGGTGGLSEGRLPALRENGYQVDSVSEESRSITDAEVLASAIARNAVLLTEDKDFGEMVFRAKRPAPGIQALRIRPLKADSTQKAP